MLFSVYKSIFYFEIHFISYKLLKLMTLYQKEYKKRKRIDYIN